VDLDEQQSGPDLAPGDALYPHVYLDPFNPQKPDERICA
jgi:hypothetical protein